MHVKGHVSWHVSAAQAQGSCSQAAAVAAGAFGDLHALLDACRLLARCLLLRQLLGGAAAAEAASLVPEAAAGLEAAALLGPPGRGTHICDLLELPRPAHTQVLALPKRPISSIKHMTSPHPPPSLFREIATYQPHCCPV